MLTALWVVFGNFIRHYTILVTSDYCQQFDLLLLFLLLHPPPPPPQYTVTADIHARIGLELERGPMWHA
jgi:hypothetical protein